MIDSLRSIAETLHGLHLHTEGCRLEEIADQLEAPSWIPVTELLPDDDLTVMIAPLESDEDVWLGFHDADGWHFVDAMPAHVSHWKPMPEGPAKMPA